ASCATHSNEPCSIFRKNAFKTHCQVETTARRVPVVTGLWPTWLLASPASEFAFAICFDLSESRQFMSLYSLVDSTAQSLRRKRQQSMSARNLTHGGLRGAVHGLCLSFLRGVFAGH